MSEHLRYICEELQRRLVADQQCVMWCVYDKPKDYPGFYVARPHIASRAGAHAIGFAISAVQLDDVRAAIPQGLTRIGRAPEDDPVIIETWI